MTRKKKTRLGAEVRSVHVEKTMPQNIWWLAVIEKGRFQIFEYLWEKKSLAKLFQTKPISFKEETFLRLRDSPGRSFDSFSWSKGGHGTASSRHSYSSRKSPKEKTTQDVLKAGSDFIKKAIQEQRFDSLALFASPQIRGGFKKMIGPRLVKKVKVEKNVPLPYLSPRELQKTLISHIPLEMEEPPRWFPRASGTHLMKRFEPLERRKE